MVPGHDEPLRDRPQAVPDPHAPAPPDPARTGPPRGRPDEPGSARRQSVQEEAAHAAALDELQDRWRRALADLENLRKRHARELERARGDERARVAAAWLPVVDNLDRAVAHGDADPGALLAGVRAVRDQAVDVLDRLGYPRREETGVPFDPARHEVAAVADTPGTPPGTVVDVLRPGYGEAGGQLRPMTVTVST
jgi:molecular chaperone GrpE